MIALESVFPQGRTGAPGLPGKQGLPGLPGPEGPKVGIMTTSYAGYFEKELKRDLFIFCLFFNHIRVRRGTLDLWVYQDCEVHQG